MKRIESLTKEQEARFGEFVQRWTAIGLSTEPADRPRAEAAIKKAYEAAGLPHPKKIVWCGSPLSLGLTRAIILDKKLIQDIGASVGDSVGASVGASVRDSVGDSVWASVGASVGDSVRDSVGDSVGASVGASVGDSVWASVGASVGDSVRASVWASVGASVRDSVWASVGASVGASVRDSVGASVGDSGYGQHDTGWLSFYSFFREAVNLTEQTDKLIGLFDLAQAAGWWLPHQHICWVSERHNILARDDRGRLHSIGGAACAYPDGWAIYAVHGVRVPGDIIEDRQSITVERIGKEENAEIRRVMIDLYGQGRYIQDCGAKEIHRDQFGILYRQELPDDEPIVMVRVENSTPEADGSIKPYFLRVHPELRPMLADQSLGDPQAFTARNAVASTFGLRGEEYAPAIET